MSEDEFYSVAAPPEHPTWTPGGKSGHFCISNRWCGCGHWGGGRRATTRVDGKRGRVDLDVVEGNAYNR